MIRILIVDDNEGKAQRVRNVISRFLEGTDFLIKAASTITEAANTLRDNLFDLLVLDLNIPMRSGEPPRKDGGIRLLNDIQRRKDLRRPAHILGLTEFEDLATSCGPSFQTELWHLVRYEQHSDEWEELLGRKLVHIVEANYRRREDYDYDIAIITALHRIELEGVLNIPCTWAKLQVAEDETIYHEGIFKRNAKQLRVVAAAATEMGMPATAALAMKVIENFRPRYIAMVGIAAGVKGNFGDILIADQSWDYGSGKNKHMKRRGSVFHPSPIPIPLSPLLKAKLSYFLLSKGPLQSIRAGWEQGSVPAELKAQMGPLASGAAVLENKPLIDEIIGHNRKLIGVEMETYGLFVAARTCKAPRPDVMSFKSICDFGDEQKNDAYQAYAAYTSSMFLYEFALQEL